MALSFAQTSTLDPMVAPKALVLLPSSLQKMPAMPSSSLMAMIGRAVHSRSARIALQALDLASVAVVALAVVAAASGEASGHVADLQVVVASVADLAAVVASAEDMAAQEVVMMLSLQLLHPTPSQIMPPLERREARPFMSAM